MTLLQILLLLAVAALAPETDVAPETLRERAARHFGVAHLTEHAHGISLHGRTRFLGSDARYELWLHPDGRFRRWIEGPLPVLTVFDGQELWERDWTGSVRTLELESAEEARAEVALLTGTWARPGSGFDVTPGKAPGTLELRVQSGYYRGTLTLDPETARPVQFVRVMDDPLQTTFDGEVRLGKLRFPARLDFAREVAPSAWTLIERGEDLPAEAFATPLPRPIAYDDVSFDPAVDAALTVHRAFTGHLLVPVSVNGHEPGWFIFDTGAGGQCVAATAPWIEALATMGESRVSGVGGSVLRPYRRADSLRVGPVTLDAPTFIELDLAFLDDVMGVRVDGILGWDLLSRVVAEIDLKEAMIQLHDPSAYTRPVPWQDLILHGRHPCVRARFEGRSGIFRLDTGAAASSVMFHAPYTRRNALLVARDTVDSSSGGVGGMVPMKDGRLTSFELAGHRVEDLGVSFALEDVGAFADEYTAGNIGGLLLEPFRLVLDYSGRRIAFVPRSEL